MRVSVATHSGQHLLLSLFICPSTLTIEIGVIWYFIVVLPYIFLVTNYTEHLFMCLFVNHISYLMRYLFKPFVCVCVNRSIVSESLQPHGLPGSSVNGILQARILGWDAIPFFRDLLDPWNDRSPALASRFFTTWAPREALLPIFNWVYCFLNLKFSEFHMYSRYKTYSSYIICRYFLLVTYLFILLTVSFAEQEF